MVQFLQHEVSKLHTRETCWHQSGVGGLLALLRANLSESKSWNSSYVSGGPYTFNATGNLFTVDLATKNFDVNTVDQDTFITLTYVHGMFYSLGDLSYVDDYSVMHDHCILLGVSYYSAHGVKYSAM